ncbi:MAG: BatA domain-containing protein, partial [Hyphomicrobium sp.]
MSLGAFAFLNPWLLGALVTLPLIYWLLRTVPPRPRQVAFPATRILVGIENREKTPAKTPWWLLLIRLLAAALVIAALAEPVLNPSRDASLKGTGPVVIAVDNGWASAQQWSSRQDQISQLITEAEAQNRPVVVMPTASTVKAVSARIEAPADARSTVAAIEPQPFAPNRKQALEALNAALSGLVKDGISAVWLTDGIDHSSDAAVFADGLSALTGAGTLAAVLDPAGREPMGLMSGLSKDGKLLAKVMRSGGPPRQGFVHAYSAKSQRLGEAAFSFANGETVKDVTFELPLELRNQVTRIEIASEKSAGAVNLLDGRSQWQRVGLLSGESQEQSQPLLAPLYFLKRAVQPFAEVIQPKDPNLAQGVDSVLQQNASVIMLADIGTIAGDLKDRLDAWVRKGGILVRFAGPRLEKGGDDLLPVALRAGGRSLGGALSWSTPQPLNAFDEASPFAGLSIPADVLVNRQVLADPSRLTPDVQVWARLTDGTPLVTAAKRGEGQLVLFHTTGNSDWSNLPISGLFVEMLQRITLLGGFNSPAAQDGQGGAPDAAATTAAADTASVLLAVQTLDGYGTLRAPPPAAQPIPVSAFAETIPSLDHPPGYYGASGLPRSL